MMWTDDPVADAERYAAEQDRRLDKLPVCKCCGKAIQQEKAVYYNNQWCCEECEYDFWHDIRDDFLERVDVND